MTPDDVKAILARSDDAYAGDVNSLCAIHGRDIPALCDALEEAWRERDAARAAGAAMRKAYEEEVARRVRAEERIEEYKREVERREEYLAWSNDDLKQSQARVKRLEEALYLSLSSLEHTCWMVDGVGSISEWAKTPEGLNHARVIEAMERIRAALAGVEK